MADKTKIEWADATLNYANGCSLASPGCTNCYAMRAGGRNLPGHPSTGLTMPTKAGHVWTGEIRLSERALQQALRWKAPRRIFWNAHGDLFHENVPDEAIDRLFAVCALTPQHTHMILTKRSARMRERISNMASLGAPYWGEVLSGMLLDALNGAPPPSWPLPNVWLGVSVEDQTRADERIPDLLAMPAAVRFISAEPLLGPVDLRNFDLDFRPGFAGFYAINALTGRNEDMCRPCRDVPKLDWVIVGGESGPGARPMHPDWARSLRDQCAAAGVAFHFKQWGDWLQVNDEVRTGDTMLMSWPEGTDGFIRQGVHMRRVGKRTAGRLLDGRTHDEMPA
jgi:protein gp37